ncbi:peptidoglycan DD-metalloendopeptidase family protein [Patescibacteria group bacterium]|nr:peptidoglycan DD-metalloendopeptidase family protein [Patescibacteria group bacterium]
MKFKVLMSSLLIVFSCAAVFYSYTTVWAEDDVDEEIDDLQDKIEKYEKKIVELQGRAKTLANEIEYMDSQINLTELRIRDSISKIVQKEQKIKELTGDINNLSERIDKLQSSIDYQTGVLQARLRERYMSQEDSPLVFLLSSDTLDQIVHKTEYLKVMGIQDNKMIDDMSKTKQSFMLQKKLYQDKKDKEEELKAELEVEKANLDYYKNSLEGQKVEKNRLLELTQNDENKYQKLLKEAEEELQQIMRAVSVLKHQDGEEVKRGDVIGIQGNTGYSFGDHLHFGVYRYGSFEDIDGWDWYYSNYVDPAKKLKSKTVYWNTGCETAGNRTIGNGDWDWPIKNPTISQGFGDTCYSDVYYGGKPHPAYDMYGPYGAAIYAVDDGEAYYCRNCLGDGGNGVFMFHGDDYMTLYWHLQ